MSLQPIAGRVGCQSNVPAFEVRQTAFMFERLPMGQRWIVIGLLLVFATSLALFLWASLSAALAWSDTPVTTWEWASFQWRSSYGESPGARMDDPRPRGDHGGSAVCAGRGVPAVGTGNADVEVTSRAGGS